jgi:hypothetical protein
MTCLVRLPPRRAALLLLAAVPALVAALSLGACTARRPVLRENEHLAAAGREAAARDVEECLRLAREMAAPPTADDAAAERVAARTAQSAATNAATGATPGADPPAGAAVGTIQGGEGGLTSLLFGPRDDSNVLDPAMRHFVEECLREKGYEVVAWE